MVNMLQRCSGLWQWQQSITERTGLGDCGVRGGMMVIRCETKSAETENKSQFARVAPDTMYDTGCRSNAGLDASRDLIK